ncbi:TRAP transporter substrate-binding protein DctP [Aquisalimonas lutea]|uniref:TRAP transporter substrate-binding protein n=1 Tax=Aquisalimonas lutea TaxID=1327750 RepID=UPI0025B590EC|nr:TRAP transporter substrate-binding protein DctP [Aquisalimonas lutea]MDN3519776.1 TRAP transporter substrate-binding protein DctP [Aquisalimonas lutea]
MQIQVRSTSALTVALGVSMAASLPLPSEASETTLRFADWLPTSHYVVEEGIQPWMEDVEEASDSSIKFDYYPAEQIGDASEMLSLVRSGVADVVHLSPAYLSDKLPLSGVAELPGLFERVCDGTHAVQQLLTPGSEVHETEYAERGVRVLWAHTYEPYRIVTVDPPVRTMEDLSGLRIRSAGGSMSTTARNVGAVPMDMTGPEMLQSMQRGTLDGTFAPLLSLYPFDLQTVLNYITTDGSMASFVSVYAISERAWNELDAEQQAVLEETSRAAAQRTCEWIDTASEQIVERLESDGLEAVEMEPGDLEELNRGLEKARAEWVETMEDSGRPASEVLSTFNDAVAERQSQ